MEKKNNDTVADIIWKNQGAEYSKKMKGRIFYVSPCRFLTTGLVTSNLIYDLDLAE